MTVQSTSVRTPQIVRAHIAEAPRQAEEISLGGRLRDWKTLLGFAISAAIVVFFVLTAHLDPAAIWANVQHADARFLILGFAVYMFAFVLRGLRWRFLLSKSAPALHTPALRSLIEMIYLSWFVNSLVPAKLGDGYRAYLLRQETGADMSATLGTVVGERMADVLALAVLLVASGLLIVGSLAGAGANLEALLLIGLALALGIGGGVLALRFFATRMPGWLPERWANLFSRFAHTLLLTFRRGVQLPLYSLTCLIWACEVLRIWLVLQSFDIGGLAPGVIIFTALAGSLLSTIPFTPAGLGAVEGASVAILGAFGIATSLAGAVAVTDRLINYWSNIPLGALLHLARSRRKTSATTSNDA